MKQNNIDSWFVTGFAEAEGCFLVSIIKDKEYRLGWSVSPRYHINLHQKDKALLEQIQSYFGVGSINYKHGSEVIKYYVQSIKDLARIIDHFEKHPLITQKLADYELFKQVFEIISNKKPLITEGIEKLVSIKASMNKGLLRTEELKAALPGITPVKRPCVLNCKIKDPNWLAGFTTGEGCFLPRIINSSNSRLGFRVQLIFKLTQHSRDGELMKSLIDYLGCGNVSVDGAVDYLVVKFSDRSSFAWLIISLKWADLTDKVIPFFVKYPILGVKSKDFADFCKVAELVQNKAHLTTEGLSYAQNS